VVALGRWAVGRRGTAVGAASGVMVDGSRCGKVVHSGAVLVAVTGSSEGDRGRRYTVA
jgi:hypothetical protein